ncbi:MAG: hypothetical protein K2M87_08320 [Muribaculaceae bacterium]|nr:hypothetical protein [Muribaculaceae bacterium]
MHFPCAEIWNKVIMPNHIHLIIAINNFNNMESQSEVALYGSTMSPKLGCLTPKRINAPEYQNFHHNTKLAVIIGQLKSTVKRETNIRKLNFAWQQRFHDHIIRNQRAYDKIMQYIDENIENWSYDQFNNNRIDIPEAPYSGRAMARPYRDN